MKTSRMLIIHVSERFDDETNERKTVFKKLHARAVKTENNINKTISVMYLFKKISIGMFVLCVVLSFAFEESKVFRMWVFNSLKTDAPKPNLNDSNQIFSFELDLTPKNL